MRILRGLAFFFLLLPVSIHAGQILGTIRQDRKALPNIPIQVTCGPHKYDGATDQFGSYSINIPEKGRCTIVVTLQGKSVGPCDLFSYDDPARDDFVVERDTNGNLKLIRR